jgi:hypothetical protein
MSLFQKPLIHESLLEENRWKAQSNVGRTPDKWPGNLFEDSSGNKITGPASAVDWMSLTVLDVRYNLD